MFSQIRRMVGGCFEDAAREVMDGPGRSLTPDMEVFTCVGPRGVSTVPTVVLTMNGVATSFK